MAALFITVVAAVMVHRVAFAFGSTADFFKLRRSVYTLLQEQTTTPIEGVTIKLPPTGNMQRRIVKQVPPDAHIQSVVRQRDWLSSSSFQFVLDLDDSVLPVEKQGSSATMAATTLLNHYFG